MSHSPLVQQHGPATMTVVEARGTPRQIGHTTGEALREQIQQRLELNPPPRTEAPDWPRRRDTIRQAMHRLMPLTLAELDATAEAADVDPDRLLYINVEAQFGATPVEEQPTDQVVADRCTNVVFAHGPDGPVWGKNNDRPRHEAPRPVCARVVQRDGGQAVIVFAYAGMVGMADGMNAAGVTIGHSSVGSTFEQRDDHAPMLLWAYEGLHRTRSTTEFLEHMTSRPLRGKGFSMVCVDAAGDAASIEAPCPLVQVRRPRPGTRHIACVNRFQLPAIEDADRRRPESKCNANARRDWLDQHLAGLDDPGLADMQAILRRTEEPAICRRPPSLTEFSMIGLPAQGRVLCLYGEPTEQEYQTLEFVSPELDSSRNGQPSAVKPPAHQRDAVFSLLIDDMKQAMRHACDWIQNTAQLQSDTLPSDTEDRKGHGYTNWRGAIRGEYSAAERKWWFMCPVWHTGQAVKALVLASEQLDDDTWMQGAHAGAEFVLNQQRRSPGDPEHGLLLAYEDVPGRVNTSAVLETLDGLMHLADATGSDELWQRIVATGDFLLRTMFNAEQAVFHNMYDPVEHGRADEFFHSKQGVVGRPLLEDGVLLKLFDRTGEQKFFDAHVRISERLVDDQNPPGNWIDYAPCRADLGRFHPRQTYWWGLPLIETYRQTGRAAFLETAIQTGHFCRRAMRADGGFIRGTYTDFRTDSFGHETSGSACAAILFLALFKQTGDAEWIAPAEQALRFCMSVQFDEPADANLKGAVLEKVLPPEGSDCSPYYLRDTGTIFFVTAACDYLHQAV